jgi:hypothetical protein
MMKNKATAGRLAVLGSFLMLSLVLLPSAPAQQAATIEAPVSTGFGVYSPLSVAPTRAEAGLSEPSISSNFTNVTTGTGRFPWSNFFNQPERALLERNSFVVRPEPFGSFGEVYNRASGGQELGSFVTVDAVLHGLRVTTAEAQRRLERDYMAPTLEKVLTTLSRAISGQIGSERDPRVVEALSRVLAYVETGRALADPSIDVNARVRDEVTSEVERIRAAGGTATSSVFPDRRINYAAFAPTGHYRLNQTFGNYYRARTWLSSVGMSLYDDDGDLDADQARMSILLARAIDAAAASEKGFASRYQDLYELTAFLGGRSDGDVTWDMLAGAVRSYYGRMIGSATSTMATDSVMLALARYAEAQLPASARNGGNMLRMLPAATSRGIVDRIGEARARLAPSTAVSAAIFSSVGAADARAAETLRRSLESRVKEDWVQSLEWALLYTMQPLVDASTESNGYPRFARSEAWRAMRTASALGAWAAYQHPLGSAATKPVRVGSSGSMESSELETSGYVEPTPEGWARVSSLAAYLRDGFASDRYDGALGRELDARLRDIENTAARLMQIAASQVSGRALSNDQLDLIESMRSRIAAYETFSDRTLSSGAPIVAGVGEGTGVLPANGHPLILYVIVPRNDGVGGLMLTRGAVYSYYEVDAAGAASWIRSMTNGNGDMRPSGSFTSAFLATDRPFAQDASRFQAIESPLPASVAYVPTKEEKKQRLFTVDLDMEANTVSASTGELWYTVRAPELNGVDIIVAVLNTAGREVYRTTPARIEAGKRYDVIRVEELLPGQYFIRVTDYTDRTLASGRFMVVR